MSERYLTDVATRHQVMLERLKTGEWRFLRSYIERLEAIVRDRLRQSDSLTAFSLGRLRAFERQIAASMQAPIEEMRTEWRTRLAAIAVSEADFEVQALRQLDTAVVFQAPVPEQVAAAAFAAPMAARGVTGDALLGTFFSRWESDSVDRVLGQISIGAATGQTNAQIERAIRGTVADNFRTGTLAAIRRAGESMVRTSVQHVSQTARQATWSANRDIISGVRWVATLDSRTTDQCASLDGQVFPVDSGPRPPIHVGCRSTTVPVLRGALAELSRDGTRAARDPDDRRRIEQVPASQTYYGWLRQQPDAFQNEAIGPTRAQLLRQGGLSAEQFADLQLGRNFQPLTLDEMRARNPAVFERAGL